MSASGDYLLDLGIRLPDLVAGAGGGLVRAILLKKGAWARSDVPNVSSSILVGGLSATYLGEPVARFFALTPTTAGFVVGLAGLVLCQIVVDQVVKHWRFGEPKS